MLPQAQGAAHYYGRSGQPTWDAVEAQLSILEAAEVVSFPSGMAAITAALVCCLKAGAKVMIPSDGYYVTRLLGRDLLAQTREHRFDLAARVAPQIEHHARGMRILFELPVKPAAVAPAQLVQ